jgi:hypothetical protein
MFNAYNNPMAATMYSPYACPNPMYYGYPAAHPQPSEEVAEGRQQAVNFEQPPAPVFY